jgi:hypothetical protein
MSDFLLMALAELAMVAAKTAVVVAVLYATGVIS